MAHLPLAFLRPRAAARARHLLRDGHELPLHAFVGDRDHGGRAGAERPAVLRRLPSRRGRLLLVLAARAVVVDDGRRFLDRTVEQYDVVVIDPPPPVEAAGSSLLYSREFYAADPAAPGRRTASCRPGSPAREPRGDRRVHRSRCATCSRTCARSRPWRAGASTCWPATGRSPTARPRSWRRAMPAGRARGPRGLGTPSDAGRAARRGPRPGGGSSTGRRSSAHGRAAHRRPAGERVLPRAAAAR